MTSRFTEDELAYIQRAVQLSDKGTYAVNVKGSGDSVPAPLLEAVADLRACLSPKWIELRCTHGYVTWKVIRCRWCDGCLNAWKAKVRAIILEGSQGTQVYMWTLTIKEYPHEVEGDIFDESQKRWHDLLRDAAKHRIRFEFLRVVELQERGTPHFHLAIKQVSRRGKSLSDTKVIARMFRRLGKKAGFGYRQDFTTDFQAARLGGAGVASYMSKYLSKSEDYNAMRRDDGRAIRRYCRSRGWSKRRADPVWRYSVAGGFSRSEKSGADTPCVCSEGFIMPRDHQAAAWVAASRLEGRWVGPLAVVEYILQKEIDSLSGGPGKAIHQR